MARISTYAIDATPTLDDKVIGTDVNDFNITKNYLLGDIMALSPSNSLTSTKMFYGSAANLPAETETLTYHVGGLGQAATDTTKITGSIVMDATDANNTDCLILGKNVAPLANRPTDINDFNDNVMVGIDLVDSVMNASLSGIQQSQIIGTKIGNGYVTDTGGYILKSTLIGSDMLNTQVPGNNQMNRTIAIGYNSLKSIRQSEDNTFVGVDMFAGNATNINPDENVFLGNGIGAATTAISFRRNVAAGYRSMSQTSGNIEDNVVIGHQAGYKFDGQDNIIIGANAAYEGVNVDKSVILTASDNSNRAQYTSADSSVIIGNQAASGNSLQSLNQDVYIGTQAGRFLDGNGHVLVGSGAFASSFQSGTDFTSVIGIGLGAFGSAENPGVPVEYPIAIGYLAASTAGAGGGSFSNSICIGTRAGQEMNGENNISIVNGAHSGAPMLGFFNIALGTNALMMQTGGDFNIAVGNDALFNLGTGTNNTAIGKAAGSTVVGFNNTTNLGHNAQAQADNEVVLGDNNVTTLRCNTQVISGLSDLRDKNNVEDLRLGVDFLMDLKPVSWDWERRDGTMEGKKDSGFIAQFTDNVVQAHSAEDILPTLVNRNNEDAWEMGNAALIPVLVKAIQELKAEINELKNGKN